MIESATTTFQVPKEFSYTLGVVFAIVLHYVVLSFWTMRHRVKYYTKEHLEKFRHLHKEHQVRTGAMGYPDYGNGVYSQKLSYKDWFNFNCVLRVHQNAVELIPAAVISLLAVGLFNPILSVFTGLIFLAVRFHYGQCYMNKAQGVETAGLISIAIIVGNIGFALMRVYGVLF